MTLCAGKMDQQIKVLTVKSEDLSSTPRTDMTGENPYL